MKRPGTRLLYVLVLLSIFGAFLAPQKTHASSTANEINQMIVNDGGNFTSIDPTFGDAYIRMVKSVAGVLQNDPDVNSFQLKIYVLQGIPGSSIPDQQGFIPLLQGIIKSNPSTDYVTKANVALSQANTLLSYAQTNSLLAGGVISSSAAAAQIQNATNNNLNSTGKVLNDANNSKKCTSIANASVVDCLDAGVSWIITHTLLQFAGYILWLTATMMNYAIKLGILNFAQWAPDSLYPVWIIIRQIVSLFVVFAGLYIGFWYILGKGEDFEKYIPWVVIFALFVNFSYPLTRTAVDVSNVISLNVYTSAVGAGTLNEDVESSKTAGGIIRDRLGLQGLVDFATGDVTTGGGVLNKINSTPGALLAVAFIAYAAYIFFRVTALIIMRTAVLVFLIVASPVLFVDSVIPKLGELAQRMRGYLFSQLLVGPVFMIMFALTLKFLEVFQTGPFKQAGSQPAITTFFNLLMMLIMLHIMLKVTEKTAGELGQMATSAMGKVGGFALGVASGGTGFLARQSIGRAAAAVRDSDWVKNNPDGFFARRTYDMSNAVAKHSFDLRSSSVIAGQAQKYGMGMTKLGMGSGGFEERVEAREKDRVERGSRIGTHRKNIYDENGNLISKKGDLDTSPEAEAARQKYISGAGGTVFATKQEKDDLKSKLEAANKAKAKAMENTIATEYSEMADGTPAEAKAKREFFEKQNQGVRDAIIKKDMEEAKATNREKEAEVNTIIANYVKATGEGKKAIFSSQDDERIKEKLLGADQESAEKDNKERVERERKMAQDEKMATAANRAADAQERILETLRAQQGGASSSGTTQTPPPSGYTTTPSGIIVPVNMNGSRPGDDSSPSTAPSGEPQPRTPPSQSPAHYNAADESMLEGIV